MHRALTILVAALLLQAPVWLRAVEPIGAFTPGARILFQGDSITDGNRGRGNDPNHILGHGYVHPTYRGHQLMADEWERVVRAKWPAHGRLPPAP